MRHAKWIFATQLNYFNILKFLLFELIYYSIYLDIGT
jgi:hypothetical protein